MVQYGVVLFWLVAVVPWLSCSHHHHHHRKNARKSAKDSRDVIPYNLRNHHKSGRKFALGVRKSTTDTLDSIPYNLRYEQNTPSKFLNVLSTNSKPFDITKYESCEDKYDKELPGYSQTNKLLILDSRDDKFSRNKLHSTETRKQQYIDKRKFNARKKSSDSGILSFNIDNIKFNNETPEYNVQDHRYNRKGWKFTGQRPKLSDIFYDVQRLDEISARKNPPESSLANKNRKFPLPVNEFTRNYLQRQSRQAASNGQFEYFRDYEQSPVFDAPPLTHMRGLENEYQQCELCIV